MNFKIGIDVGGTFTDLFLWSSDGSVTTFKTLSTPDDPSEAVLVGLQSIADSLGMTEKDFAQQITTIVHGTTVTTNATLTRNGAKTGLLTTMGLRDALEMRRGVRERQYDNRYQNVVPLVPRHLRLTVPGRLDYAGREVDPLDLGSVREAVKVFADEGVEAVTICFMNSFANPAQERAAAEVLAEALPDTFLTVSSTLLPTIRFYNRVSTTVLNSYVGPILRRYLSSLTDKLNTFGFTGVLRIMQSGGGIAMPDVTQERPAMTLLSGPAGGPRAAGVYAELHGAKSCVVVDMGGTSFDASLVRDGRAAMERESEIDRLRIALPMLDITTIGAGGGSIGWIDEGGLLRMGPQSASAKPGPACYGRGGTLPTCTDANVVLGYLDPNYFAGGKLKLDGDAAREAVTKNIANPLGSTTDEAAAGMYRVINTNMAHGVREITVKRGLDPREFPMVVAGGAGSLHACMIAHELDMKTLLVPSTASVLCAAGMLLSDLMHDEVRSFMSRLDDLNFEKLGTLTDDMMSVGNRQIGVEQLQNKVSHEIAFDLRYCKQYHEVTVTVPHADIARRATDAIAEAFHAEHNRLYGYDLGREGTPIELITVRVRTTGHTDKPALPRIATGSKDPARAFKSKRRVFVPESGSFAEVPVFDGHRLEAGNVIEGPALIERSDTTILVSESFIGTIDEYNSCLLQARS